MSREHRVEAVQIHHEWDGRLEPAAVIRSGDTVTFECPLGGDPAMEEHSTLEDIDTAALRFNLAGPVYVEGARPGDTLEIEVLDLGPGDWGYTMILPELGLLSADFPSAYLKTWNLRRRSEAELVPGVAVPIDPFLGTMGTDPGLPGRVDPMAPHRGGGNIDNRHLTRSARLWLPVWREGALFSTGDGHAAQGDGEVCVSAIECAMTATLRFTLHRTSIPAPRFAASAPPGDHGPYWGTMGIADDLLEGARIAARAMIAWLVDERSLAPKDAYVLCSVAADLKIHEVVDGGVWNVGMTLPLSTFRSTGL